MIPFNFIYYRPYTLKETSDILTEYKSKGMSALLYAGGSEIITMCRAGSIKPDAVIDIKNILECSLMAMDGSYLNIGAVCTLNTISESKLFPLLGLSCSRIADHTNQCRITIGGNLCGTIIYKETSLPLLLSDAEVTVFGQNGERRVSFASVFDKKMQLDMSEIVVQLHIPAWALNAKHYHIKKVANEKIDYPLVSLAALCKDNFLRVAFSGLYIYPFRNTQMERALNDTYFSYESRIDNALKMLPEPPINSVEGSSEYRMFVLRNTLSELLEDWNDGKI